MTLLLEEATWFLSNHRRTSSSRMFPSLAQASDASSVREGCKRLASGDTNVAESVALFIFYPSAMFIGEDGEYKANTIEFLPWANASAM
jgi:hypothetical protein